MPIDPKFDAFDELWAIDSEFISDGGDPYRVVCFCGIELRSGRTFKVSGEALKSAFPPFRTDDKSLAIVFAGTAECGSMLSLGWPLPQKMLDLSPEYWRHVNGRTKPGEGRGLLDALGRYGLPAMHKHEKDYWRSVVMSGGPWSDSEMVGIENYCLIDSEETARLFNSMQTIIDLPRALLRAEFVKVSAIEEYNGLPIDMEIFKPLSCQSIWDEIRFSLIPVVDAEYNVYEGRSFNTKKFEAYLQRNAIPWPTADSGRPDLRDDTFRDMAKVYPQLTPLRELRDTLDKLRKIKLQVGSDGRARTVLWPFSSKTGRTQPKATQFLFGPSCWIRSLLKPAPGMAIAYADWSAMEFFLAAALSGDKAMLDAYAGDPYLATAIAFGYAPHGATKKTHGTIRDQFKVVLLAGQYGMSPQALAARLACPVSEAAEILQRHKLQFSTFWRWCEAWPDFTN
jgi:DNA polymerase I